MAKSNWYLAIGPRNSISLEDSPRLTQLLRPLGHNDCELMDEIRLLAAAAFSRGQAHMADELAEAHAADVHRAERAEAEVLASASLLSRKAEELVALRRRADRADERLARCLEKVQTIRDRVDELLGEQ